MVVDDDNNNDDNDEDDGDLEGINVLFHHIKDPTNAYTTELSILIPPISTNEIVYTVCCIEKRSLNKFSSTFSCFCDLSQSSYRIEHFMSVVLM